MHIRSQKVTTYDVVVACATPAGISAAITAARRGLSVALVDPLPEPGQMLSNGLCIFDTAHRAGVTGVMSEFAERVAAYHHRHKVYRDDPAVTENLGAPRHGAADGLGFEPKVAARILGEMIADTPGLSYFPRHAFGGVLMEGKRCVGIQTRVIGSEGEKFDPLSIYLLPDPEAQTVDFRGGCIIDATYEGDIAAWAGVPFRSGRDERSREEPHNGHIMSDYHTGRKAAEAGWLPETFLPGGTGAADPRVMGYNTRFLIKNFGQAEGPHRLARPENYDAGRYGNGWRPSDVSFTPGGKWFVNIMNRGNNLQGELLGTYPDGSPEQRRKVVAAIYERAREYLYFLQTERGCPNWGLAPDEFPLNDGWPYRVYVREARRIIGMAALTESDMHRWMPRPGDSFRDGLRGDLTRARLQPQSVAVGDYDFDCHPCDDEPSAEYKTSGEGGFMYSSLRSPFQVPYGCMVPREIEGLLVTCAVSVSHVAMTAVRMEPVWSQLGQAAGTAAVLAHQTGKSFRELPAEAVQAELLQQGCQLYYYTDVSPKHPAFRAIQQLSLAGVMSGFPDWTFRPERLITRGQWAQALAAAYALWPSVTAHHFDDVPPDHAAFLAVETLYDHGARAGIHVVTWERYQKVWSDDSLGWRFYFRPDADITWSEAAAMKAALERTTSVTLDPALRILGPRQCAPSESGNDANRDPSLQNLEVRADQAREGFLTRGDAALLLLPARRGRLRGNREDKAALKSVGRMLIQLML